MFSFDLFYYFFMFLVFFGAFFGLDFFGVSAIAPVFFIIEFAAILVAHIHIFVVNWQSKAPSFLKKKEPFLEIAFGYVFFFVWAGIILLNNNYFFPFVSFVVSAVSKGISIHKTNPESQEFSVLLKKNSVLSFSMFLAMATMLGLSFLLCNNCANNAIFGSVYYAIAIVLTWLALKIAKNKP